jgi:hypothetical protein
LHDAIRIAFGRQEHNEWRFEVRDTELWSKKTSHAQPILKIGEYSYVGLGRRSADTTTIEDIINDPRYGSRVVLYVSGSGSDAFTYTLYKKGSAVPLRIPSNLEALNSLERIALMDGQGKLLRETPHNIYPFERAELDVINWQLRQISVPLPPKTRAELLAIIENEQQQQSWDRMEYTRDIYAEARRTGVNFGELQAEKSRPIYLRDSEGRQYKQSFAWPNTNECRSSQGRKRGRDEELEVAMEADRPSSRRIRCW